VERLLILSVCAVTWPLWAPFLRRVLEEIRAADADDGPRASPARAPRRGGRLVNTGWDDMHLSRRRRTYAEREGGGGFGRRG
jgi:hypothetical protein